MELIEVRGFTVAWCHASPWVSRCSVRKLNTGIRHLLLETCNHSTPSLVGELPVYIHLRETVLKTVVRQHNLRDKTVTRMILILTLKLALKLQLRVKLPEQNNSNNKIKM